MISLTPSRRTISVASEADVMEGGMMASGGALAAGVRVGSRLLGDPSAQQVTFRAPAARDTGKRIQYYPLVNVRPTVRALSKNQERGGMLRGSCRAGQRPEPSSAAVCASLCGRRAGDAGQHEHRVQHRIQELHTGARHAQGESVSHSSGDGSICQFGDRGCSRGWVLGVSLQAYVTDGPMPCRVAGFILGCILFFRCTSLLVVTLLLATDLWPPALMHHLLCSLLGLSTMLLEARPLLCTAHARKKTREYLKLFSFLWGRGVLNLIIAALLVLRYPEVTDLSLAGAFAALAAIDVVVGVASQRRLQALRETLTEDEKLLKDKFEAHRDASGKVQAKELAAICTELGSRLSHDELEHAILTVDVSHAIASDRCHHHVVAQSHSRLCVCRRPGAASWTTKPLSTGACTLAFTSSPLSPCPAAS